MKEMQDEIKKLNIELKNKEDELDKIDGKVKSLHEEKEVCI